MPIELVWTEELDEGFDVEVFASGLLDRAIENIKEDGYVQSAVWYVTSNELHCYCVAFSGFEEKEAAYEQVVRTARNLRATAIITLNDVYVGDCDSETYKWGQLAADHEGEALWVTVTGPGRANWSKEVRYRRQGEHFLFSLPVTEQRISIGLLRDWAKKGERTN